MNSKLAAKIQAVNNCHAAFNKHYPSFQSFFETQIGKKVATRKERFVKSFDSQKFTTIDDNTICKVRPLVFPLAYYIVFEAYSCVQVDDFTQESYVLREPICGLNEGIVGRLCDFKPKKCDYTTDDVTEKIELYLKLMNQVKDIEAGYYPMFASYLK